MADYEQRGTLCGKTPPILVESQNEKKFSFISLSVLICLLAGTWMGSEVVIDAVVFLVRVICGVFCGASAGFFAGLIVASLFGEYVDGKTATRQPDDHTDVSVVELFFLFAGLGGAIIGLVVGVIVEFAA